MNLFRDIVLLATMIGFCGILVAYVWLCGRIIGPEPDSLTEGTEGTDASSPVAVGEGGSR